MAQSEPIPFSPTAPPLSSSHRTRLRAGFLLCCAAFGLCLLSLVATLGADMIASSSGVELREQYDLQLKLAATITEVAVDSLFIGGLVCLYLAPNGERWRMVSAALLCMSGADVAILCYRWMSSGAAALGWVENLGVTLGWIELWMLAVLAAETAEAIGRPDLTYQTEMAGRFILWGGVAWLAYLIWSFDPKQLSDPAREVAPGEFVALLFFAWSVLLLISIGRTVLFCGGLVAALSAGRDLPPGQPASSGD